MNEDDTTRITGEATGGRGNVPTEPKNQESTCYSLRLQVRIGKRLSTDAASLTATALDRSISISARGGGPIAESEWIVLEARGFLSGAEAHQYGERLRMLATIGGLCSHLGIDAGRDEVLSGFSDLAVQKMGVADDLRVPPEIHGILVLPDDDKSLFIFSGPSRISVMSDPAQLLEAIETLSDCSRSFDPAKYPDSLINSLRLLNLAMIADDRRAKIVLAIAAVEGLIRNEKWSDRQRHWFTDTIASLQREDDDELTEIARALTSQSQHRVSLRQGVFRLLKENGLEAFKSSWDDLYGRRSGLFHGTLDLNRTEMNRLANDTVGLCVTIILTILRNRRVLLPRIAMVHFADLEVVQGTAEEIEGPPADST